MILISSWLITGKEMQRKKLQLSSTKWYDVYVYNLNVGDNYNNKIITVDHIRDREKKYKEEDLTGIRMHNKK